MKNCRICKLEYDESEFYKGRAKCNKCRKEIRAKNYEEKKKNISVNGTKICTKCHNEQPSKEFGVDNSQCRTCLNTIRREKNEKIRTNEIEIKVPDDHKLCKYCYTVKSLVYFRENRNKCKECENKERVAYKNKSIQKLAKSYSYTDEFAKQCKSSCRSRLFDVLSKELLNKLSKTNRFNYVEEILKADFNLIAKWLQYNFNTDMSNQNYGDIWNIDHVIPLNNTNFGEDINDKSFIILGWYNLSPIYTSQNNKKYTKILQENINKHLEKVNKFAYENNLEIPIEYINICATHLGAGNS